MIYDCWHQLWLPWNNNCLQFAREFALMPPKVWKCWRQRDNIRLWLEKPCYMSAMYVHEKYRVLKRWTCCIILIINHFIFTPEAYYFLYSMFGLFLSFPVVKWLSNCNEGQSNIDQLGTKPLLIQLLMCMETNMIFYKTINYNSPPNPLTSLHYSWKMSQKSNGSTVSVFSHISVPIVLTLFNFLIKFSWPSL